MAEVHKINPATEPPKITITDPQRTPVVFVSDVEAGFINGVCNLTFVTAQFTPDGSGKIDLDLVVSSRLRMDLYCVQQLHKRLETILANNTKPPKDKSS